jgi:alkanesulfonate monooxygenase SsuD/methylene tetrahydromethanopterin reductase-like flavin-dependent oxidoreductase (luciferase family)
MHRNWAETLKEDREAIILADKLGFHDAFMGEHLTDACENITNSMMFQASLISDTTQIKLATGTANLSHMHPVLIAVQSAMFDHMAEGRFILGVSPGALTTDAEAPAPSSIATRCCRGDRCHPRHLGARSAL